MMRSNNKPLRMGVAGLGRIGWDFHCKTLAGHGDCRLTAVADSDEARCREAETIFGCRAYRDFRGMVEQADLDAVVIATPTHLHRSMAVQALDSGLHVLLEKPMALCYDDAKWIADAAERNKRVLSVYQPNRHAAYFQQLLHLARDGRIGRIYSVERGVFKYARRDDWQALKKYGGGMLNNYGAHYLDQIMQLIGYDIKRVFCHLQRVASLGDADDVVKVAMEAAGGVFGECTINQASAATPYECVVWGTRGTLIFGGGEFRMRYFDPHDLPVKKLDPGLASKDRQYPSDAISWKEETVSVDPSFQVDVFADFAKAVRDGSPVAVPPAQTLELMRLIDRCQAESTGIHSMSQR